MVASGFGVTVMPEFTHVDIATVARPLAEPEFLRQLSLVAVARRLIPAPSHMRYLFGLSALSTTPRTKASSSFCRENHRR